MLKRYFKRDKIREQYWQSQSNQGKGAKPKALFVSGLFSNSQGGGIKTDLEKQGFEVDSLEWHEDMPPAENYDIIIGHSAGATVVELEYGGSGTQVLSLSSPTGFTADNINHSQNALDPVNYSTLSGVVNVIKGIFTGDTFFSLKGHSATEAYNQSEDK